MKARALLTLLCGLTLLFTCISCKTAAKIHPMVGKEAPAFSLEDMQGKQISLAELAGKPVLLEFWAPWCAGCLDNIPAMKELYGRFGGKIHILAPSSELGRQNVGRFIEQHELPYTVVFSNRKLLRQYEASSIPLTILIDGQGVVRYRHLGRLSSKVVAKRITDALQK